MPTHTHTCVVDGHTWECFEQKILTKCPVSVAAKVNKDGPYCELCRHLEMARRHAQVRGIILTITRSDRP